MDDLTAVAATVASRAAVLNVSMTNWTIALGLARVCSGGFSDEVEVAWIAEFLLNSFDAFSASYGIRRDNRIQMIQVPDGTN